MCGDAGSDPTQYDAPVTPRPPAIHEVSGGPRPEYRVSDWEHTVNRQPEADAVIAATPLPDGWSITAWPVRTYKWRSLWRLSLYHNGLIEFGADAYNLPGLVKVAQAHAERESRSLVITTDLDGWIRDISEAS